MHIYEYRCEECRRVIEFFSHRVSGKPDRLVCVHCGSGRLKRALSTMALPGRTDTHAALPSSCSLSKG